VSELNQAVERHYVQGPRALGLMIMLARWYNISRRGPRLIAVIDAEADVQAVKVYAR
jgi:hypothetical protein